MELNWSTPGVHLVEPVPLQHRRLDERGGRVRVVLEELRRAGTVEGEVEPAVDRGAALAVVRFPRSLDGRHGRLRDPERIVQLVRDDVLDRLERQSMDLVRRGFDARDLAVREAIGG